jgi:hypothetical protein
MSEARIKELARLICKRFKTLKARRAYIMGLYEASKLQEELN